MLCSSHPLTRTANDRSTNREKSSNNLTWLALTEKSPQKESVGFTEGEFAERTGKWMLANGGVLAADDFANYKTVIREPIRTTYRGYEIIGFPPPSSGGVHVGQILNILESFDLKKLHADDPVTFKHVVAEAMKLAFADRAYWLGDPDFVNVPRGLIDKKYAAELAARIDLSEVSKSCISWDAAPR